ncbi:ABC transporter permease [Aneurinibacillus uraniidurans]|uniref:ABC transporter permease n=1 Tax=Aneurinibacillus uraniidurans TaxID=2966586 RepID=UPI00234BBC17|nr:ABC transporter permease [Aneurinibacillus sp. B1]WCN37478.1 ABC transporter permease [Aneurinibacillus sp. B1]
MSIRESLFVALDGIRANKLRSFLTMLGIIIGIASVIAIMTLGRSGQAAIIGEVSKFGISNFDVWTTYDTQEEADSNALLVEDAEYLPQISPYISSIAAYMEMGRTTLYNQDGKKKAARVSAVTATLLDVKSTTRVVQGRFFTEEDDKSRRAVIVLDEKLARDLFGSQNPIGQRVRFEKVNVTVIGLVREEKFRFDNSQVQNAYVPIRFLQDVYGTKSVSNLEVKATGKEAVTPAMQQVKNFLNRKHNHKDYYQTVSLEDQIASFTKVTDVITLVFSIVAGISLVVGGIGVMNIMLVSVTERTREIGIRKALGARRQHILLQFLLESLILSLIGGAIGVLLGVGASAAVFLYADMPFLLSWEAVIIAFSVSSSIGVFFGLYPANKAAKLHPIEALRYE